MTGGFAGSAKIYPAAVGVRLINTGHWMTGRGAATASNLKRVIWTGE